MNKLIVAQVFNALEAGGVDTKNMQATKRELIEPLTTKKENIGEEGDVKSKEELRKKCLELYNNTGGANLVSAQRSVVMVTKWERGKRGAAKGATIAVGAIAELFGNVTGIF